MACQVQQGRILRQPLLPASHSHSKGASSGWEGFPLKHAAKSLAPLNGFHAVKCPLVG